MSKLRRQRIDIKPYRSRYEWDIATNLTRKKAKFEYEKTRVTYVKPKTVESICLDCGSNSIGIFGTYTPDFKLLRNSIFIEAKGLFVPADRAKIIAVLNGNNELDRDNFRILFYDNRWTTPTHRERYGDWADRHDIQWAIGPEVPDEWLQ